MKRRNFIKTIGASFLSIPSISDANFYQSDLNEVIDKFIKNKQYITGFNTGLKYIDEKISGLSKGDLFVIAARPFMGKSILANNIIKNISISYSVPVGCFYEDGDYLFYRNLIASHGKIKYNQISHDIGQCIKNLGSENFTQSLDIINNYNTIVDFTRFITLDELLEGATNLIDTHGIKLLVIDSLENIYDKNKGISHESSIPFIKKLAVKLDIPVIVTCGLNRNLEDRDDKYPCLTDLEHYRVFDQHADSILYLYRDCVYNEYCEDKNRVNVVFDKTKFGYRGMISLVFDRDYMRFV